MIKKNVLILYHKDCHIIAQKRSELRSLIICMYISLGCKAWSHSVHPFRPKKYVCLLLSDHPFLGTDVGPFPNFNNSVLTTRRNLLLHC